MTYQILPDLSPDDYAALKADIAARGVMVAVEYDDAGNVIDGHHRLRICQELGLTDWPKSIRTYADDAAKRTQARKLNIARRHLDRATKRALAEQELKENPVRSNRRVAAELGVNHAMIGSVRKELEEIGEITQSDRVERRGGGTYPSSRSKRVAPAEPPPKRKYANGHGAKVSLPENVTLEAVVRRGMAMEAEGTQPPEIAKTIKIAEITYRHARDVVLLTERNDLRPADVDLAKQVLAEMNATNQITRPYERLEPLARKLWGDDRRGGRTMIEAYRLECFDRAFSSLIQTCSTANEIEIPYLSPGRATEALAELTAAQKPIRELITKLKEASRE